MTVWGQGKVNVNTANAQTLLAVICGNAPAAPLCNDPTQASKFLMIADTLRSFTMGAPLFGSPKGFINTMKGLGPLGTVLKTLEIQPVVFLSEDLTMKSITTESKVFSIYTTGTVKSGKRETRVKIHAVVDFRGAPPPGMPNLSQLQALGLAGSGGTTGSGTGASGTGGTGGTGGTAANPNAISAAMQPSPAGNVVYYRIN